MSERLNDLSDQAALEKRFSRLAVFDHIVVAVSGGADSTALLALISDWAQRADLRPGAVMVATVDHGLRPGSAAEAAHVADRAAGLGLAHRILSWQGEKPTSGLQAAARAARYGLICDYTRGLDGRSVIVTGHTMDDQAETVLMRLGRGSGPDGLAAIPAWSRIGDLEISRPLLDLCHEELVSYLRERGLAWIEDPSNDVRDFERVRIRHAGEARRQLGLGDRALARTALRMARVRRVLEAAVDEALAQVIAGSGQLACGVVRWSDAQRRSLEAETGIRLLRRLVHALGAQELAPELGQVEDLFNELQAEEFAGGTLAGCRLLRQVGADGPETLLFREAGRFVVAETVLTGGEQIVWDRRFRIICRESAGGQFMVKACDQDCVSAFIEQGGLALPDGLPRAVLPTLPAIWRDNRPAAVPCLGWFLGEVAVDVAFRTETFRSVVGGDTEPG